MTRSPIAPLVAATLLLLPLLAPSGASAQRVIDAPFPDPTPMSAVATAGQLRASARVERAQLRAMLAERRHVHLARLRQYVETGIFPANTYQEGFLNVFQDEEGHLCAVANLMALDGRLPMVQATASSTNFIRLVDVHDGPLLGWILESGFTQEEIGRIQEPYFEMPTESPNAMREAAEREKLRLQGVLGRVLRRLERREQRSLDLAVERLLASQHHRAEVEVAIADR